MQIPDELDDTTVTAPEVPEPVPDNAHVAKWSGFLADCGTLAGRINPYQHAGRLTRINGLVMEAAGLKLPLGSGCRIMVPGGNSCEAEVVGFNGEKLFMMPTDDVIGLAPGAQVIASVTFIAVLMTILIQAPTTQWLGRRLGLLEE